MITKKSRLDRALQREILIIASKHYPNVIPNNEYVSLQQGRNNGEAQTLVNTKYLVEHGLMEIKKISIPAPKGIIGSSSVDRFKVTAKGLDFIEDDGGLTAILGTVTVRFDEGTLRALMAEKVKLADISQPEKSKLLSGIQSLSGDAIRHLTLKLLDKGVESIPRAIEIIGNSLT